MEDTNHSAATESWDEQYRSGRWAYLSSVEQTPRYALIAAWIACLGPEGSVLDVGCGEGILTDWLRSCRHYDGVDVSQVALAKARRRSLPSETWEFHCASAESFPATCSRRFDYVVFNEVLYCCAHPVKVLARYERLLEPGGHMIVSVTGFEPLLWNDIQSLYGHRFVRCLRVEDKLGMKSWNLAAIAANP